MSNLETASFQVAYQLLQGELANGTPSPTVVRKTLPLSELEVVTSVLQPRSIGDMASSEAHIRTLMDAAMNEHKNLLDPLCIWWSGQRWLIVDGHHRLEAYRRLQSNGKGASVVPVEVFVGTLKQAIIEATKRNAKDKLPMTKDDKSNRAWQLVMIGSEFSKREIAKVCAVATSTVGRMRAKLEEIKAEYPETWSEEIDGLTWREVQSLDDIREYDDGWQEQQAKEWAKRLAKTFGNKPATQPQLFARALELYSPHLMEGLTEWLSRDHDNDDF